MRILKINQRITERNSIALEKYLLEVSKFGTISADKEVQLIYAYRSGDKKALEKLIKANLRFVISVAKTYQSQGLGLEDLINEGNIGLIKALERYDETKGFKFISYAVWWIRQSILLALAENARLVRLPQNKLSKCLAVKKDIERFVQENYREPEYHEIEDLLPIKLREEEFLSGQNFKHISLHEPLNFNSEDSDITYENILKTDESNKADFRINQKSKLNLLNSVINKLNQREQTILKASFGIGFGCPMNLEDIGELCGLTRERVRQLREKALQRLRSENNLELLSQCV
jgi:RNA polymerase primary sigma factor